MNRAREKSELSERRGTGCIYATARKGRVPGLCRLVIGGFDERGICSKGRSIEREIEPGNAD